MKGARAGPPPGGSAPRSRLILVIAAAAILGGLAGAGVWWARGPAGSHVASVAPVPVVAPAPVSPPVPQPVSPPMMAPTPVSVVAVPPVPRPAPFAPPSATEAEILADAPETLKVYRFAPQPSIIVLQFPTLTEQGRSLNRVAALLEKNGFPRNRILPDGELESRIRATGAEPDTFYFGHDYRAADLVRFFAMAADAGVALTAEEIRLRELMGKLGWKADTEGALISLVKQDLASGVDAKARATILRHELSHGLYFTSPDYVAYVQQFWQQTLTARERTTFTSYLANDGYDPALSDLIVNETQAYLMHTADQRFFSAAAIGMQETRLATLRVVFLTGMPPSWLRDCTVLPPGPAGVIPVRAPRRNPDAPQRRGVVRTIRTEADRRTRLAAAASRAARNSRT